MRSRIVVNVRCMSGCRVHQKEAEIKRNGIERIGSDDLSRIEWLAVAGQVSTGTSSPASAISAVESAGYESLPGRESGLYDTSHGLGIRDAGL
jgi:hypothetical protein